MKATFGPGSAPLSGSVRVPGDKSLSHRAVLFAAMAEGRSSLSGILDSADVRSTIGAVVSLGAEVDLHAVADGSLAGSVEGWGGRGPAVQDADIDCGNSGTTARLLMGVLAGWPVVVRLVGDASLSTRPMRPVTDPLTQMGAAFETAPGDTLPVTVRGSAGLAPISYASPIASAQVKSAVLLAGLRARGGVRVTEPAPSRNHTELLLPAFGVPVKVDSANRAASLCGPVVLRATEVAVPSDPSSAAFLAVAAALVEGSAITLTGVSLNETRIGFLRVLERMGVAIRVHEQEGAGAEPVGDISVSFSGCLECTTVRAEEVPSLVDEVPILALAASRALGTTRFEGVSELRVKESDRLAATEAGLRALGVEVETGADWLEVHGPAQLSGVPLDSLGDHRLAMTWAVAGLLADAPVVIDRFEAVEVSYPGFARDLATLST